VTAYIALSLAEGTAKKNQICVFCNPPFPQRNIVKFMSFISTAIISSAVYTFRGAH